MHAVYQGKMANMMKLGRARLSRFLLAYTDSQTIFIGRTLRASSLLEAVPGPPADKSTTRRNQYGRKNGEHTAQYVHHRTTELKEQDSIDEEIAASHHSGQSASLYPA